VEEDDGGDEETGIDQKRSKIMTAPATYGIELNERIKTFDCPDCGKKQMTVWGFVSRNDIAHAIYYAGLMTGHDQTSVRLTVSIGGWGVENVDERKVEARHWIFMEARPTSDRYELMVREPEESDYFDKPILGKPMDRTEALASPLLDEFFTVADFVAFNDPAVKSYLIGREISISGRKGID
jgi:hypothetical protein